MGMLNKYNAEGFSVQGPGRRMGRPVGHLAWPGLDCGRSEELLFRGSICAEVRKPKGAWDVPQCVNGPV